MSTEKETLETFEKIDENKEMLSLLRGMKYEQNSILRKIDLLISKQKELLDRQYWMLGDGKPKPVLDRDGRYIEDATYPETTDEELKMMDCIFVRYREEFLQDHGDTHIGIYKADDGTLKYNYDKDFDDLMNKLPAKRAFIGGTVEKEPPEILGIY